MFRLDFATAKSNSSNRRDWCKQFTVVSFVENVGVFYMVGKLYFEVGTLEV